MKASQLSACARSMVPCRGNSSFSGVRSAMNSRVAAFWVSTWPSSSTRTGVWAIELSARTFIVIGSSSFLEINLDGLILDPCFLKREVVGRRAGASVVVERDHDSAFRLLALESEGSAAQRLSPRSVAGRSECRGAAVNGQFNPRSHSWSHSKPGTAPPLRSPRTAPSFLAGSGTRTGASSPRRTSDPGSASRFAPGSVGSP